MIKTDNLSQRVENRLAANANIDLMGLEKSLRSKIA